MQEYVVNNVVKGVALLCYPLSCIRLDEAGMAEVQIKVVAGNANVHRVQFDPGYGLKVVQPIQLVNHRTAANAQGQN